MVQLITTTSGPHGAGSVGLGRYQRRQPLPKRIVDQVSVDDGWTIEGFSPR